MRQGKWIAGMLLGISAGLPATGCFTGGVYQVPEHGSLSADLTAEAAPRVARGQQVDPPDPRLRGQLTPPVVVPPPPPPAGNNGTLQVSGKTVRVSVRAWVNGKPIFDDEVMQGISPALMRDAATMPEPRRTERLTEAYNQALEGIIDQEVAFQDAVHKLEAGNKKALEKLKKIAVEDFEKQMKKIRDGKRATEEQIKEVEHILKRQSERNLISGEYIRSRIFDLLKQAANPVAIQTYYKEHLNEFQRLDTVKWQDVFIAVSKQRPTIAHAKRYAEELILKCRTEEDFTKLIQLDEGDSKFRGGEGLGARKGEIKPPEVEDVLFRLKDGQIGPVIELSTGVHIVRVTKREYAGLTPLDDKTQKLIENKIKSVVFEHEYKRILRDLRSRATIEIERDGP
ncbi:MAG TPA: peptidylprolyl isomerase [Gemmataceae bacterium]|jgi:parvulin-like peptidyl-prolyl isomerase|nr:peptidylprolyl isomerase [Gemmataceae bacterium]